MKHDPRLGALRYALLVVALLSTTPDTRADPFDRFDTLVALTSRRDRSTRYGATVALIDLARSKAAVTDYTPRLHKLVLEHKNRRVRMAAAVVLDDLSRVRSIRPLSIVLRTDDDAYVRRLAAHALGRIGLRRDVNPARYDQRLAMLREAARLDPNVGVRMRAAHALVEILGQGARPYLQRAHAAADTLGGSGTAELRAVLGQMDERATFLGHPQRGPEFSNSATLSPEKETTGWYRGTKYMLYTPRKYDRTLPTRGLWRVPLLVSVHGTLGTARPYLRHCKKDAEKYRVLVLAPHFDYGTFPDFGNLNPWPGYERADLRLLEIIRVVGQRAGVDVRKFNIFGHSQGGQFVHRFVLVHSDRIHRAAACAAGNYVDPFENEVFPWGTRQNPYMPNVRFRFGRLVRSKLAIIVGTNDVASTGMDGDDRPHRRRFAAVDFAERVRKYAEDHDLQSRVKTRLTRGGEHSGGDNYPVASQYLFMEKVWQMRDDF